MKKTKRLPIFHVIEDIRNYRKWIRIIKEERNNKNSKFHQFGMDHNYFFILYMVVTLPQEDEVLPDNIKQLKVFEVLAPVHQYLDSDLGFAGYIVPEFNQFFDEEGNPTLTYGIVYRFAFNRLSIGWVLSRGLFAGLLTWALTHWPILSTLWELIF